MSTREPVFTRRDPLFEQEEKEIFSRFLRPQLDLSGASPREITNFFSKFVATKTEMSPEIVEDILEKGLELGELELAEIEQKVRGLPEDLVYVFTKFLLDHPHKEGMGMLVNFCLEKMGEESAREMRVYGLTTSPEAALLVCGSPEVFANFLQETHSVARVDEYLQFLIQCAHRFDKNPYYVSVLRNFVEHVEAGVTHPTQTKPIPLTPCLLPYRMALAGFDIHISAVRRNQSTAFFTHFYSCPPAPPQSFVHIPPNYTHNNREREVFGEILYKHAKGPEYLQEVVHFGTVAGLAQNIDRLPPSSSYILEYVYQVITTGQPFFEYPQAITQLLTFMEKIGERKSFVDYLQQLMAGSFCRSAFLKHLEVYEKMFGISYESKMQEWFAQDPSLFGMRPDLVVKYQLAPKEQVGEMVGGGVRTEEFHDFVGGIANLFPHEPYRELEQKLLPLCPAVFAQQTPKELKQLDDDVVFAGFVRAVEDLRNKETLAYLVARFSFPTLITRLVEGGVSLDTTVVRGLLADYTTDEDIAFFVKNYGAHVLDRDGVLARRISSISVAEALPYYQALLHEGHYTRLLHAYVVASKNEGKSREHADLIWSVLMREVKKNPELYVTVVRALYEEGAATVAEHFEQFQAISPDAVIPYLQQHPTQLFDSAIENFARDVGGDFEKEIKELQKEFAPLGVSDERFQEMRTPQIVLRTNVFATRELVGVLAMADFEDDSFQQNVYVTMRTPLIEQFFKQGGVISPEELTPEFARQCYLLFVMRKGYPASQPISDFNELQAEITRRFEQEFREKFHTTPQGEVGPEYAESLFLYQSYADTHRDSHPDISSAAARYAPFVFHPHYADWKMFGVTHQPTNEEARKLFEKMRATRMVPARCTFEQYRGWVKTENVSQNELFEQDLASLHTSVRALFEHAVIDRHLPMDALRFVATDREKYDALREQLRSLKERERVLRKQYPRESEMPLLAHRELEEITHELAEFRGANQKELQKLTAQLYIHQLQKISVNELEHSSLDISSHKITLAQVEQAILKEYGGEMAATLSTARQFMTHFAEGLRAKGTRSRSVLSATDNVDLSTYIRIGEKPCSSCQNPFDTNSTGLLSVIVDPHVKVVQVYAQGRIVGRAIMRLMSTQDGEPAIFLERRYKSHVSSQVEDLLCEVARKKAREMGVAAFVHDRSSFGKQTLIQYNSRSPFTYSDSVGNLLGSMIVGRSFRVSQHTRKLT